MRTVALLLIVFASVGTASAECAWVLWEQSYYVKDWSKDRRVVELRKRSPPGFQIPGFDDRVEPPKREWVILSAAPDAGECKRNALVEAKKRSVTLQVVYKLSAEKVVIGADGIAVGVMTEDGVTSSFSYVCLPEAIDPRGPKGK
jgi:hypothetical protein